MLFPRPSCKGVDEFVLFHVLTSLTLFLNERDDQTSSAPYPTTPTPPRLAKISFLFLMVEALEAREKRSGRGVLHVSEGEPDALLPY